MKKNYYEFISKIIISNINNINVSEQEKKEILVDLVKKLEVK